MHRLLFAGRFESTTESALVPGDNRNTGMMALTNAVRRFPKLQTEFIDQVERYLHRRGSYRKLHGAPGRIAAQLAGVEH